MFTLSMKSNINAAIINLRATRDQIALAAAKALTFTAERVKLAEVIEMQSIFDRPTPFTLNSLYLEMATPRNLESHVGFKGVWPATGRDPKYGSHYLEPQVFGGDRPLHATEKALIAAGFMQPDMAAVPGERATLDSYGNMSKGQLMQIRSALQVAQQRLGYSANRTPGSIKQRGRALPNYLVFGQPHPGMPAGVWQREGATGLRPILIFVRKPHYRPIYDFYGIAQRVTDDEWQPTLDREMQRVVAPLPLPWAA